MLRSDKNFPYRVLVANLLLLFMMGLILRGWTWALYDELVWTHFFGKNQNIFHWMRWDWLENGRFRPMSFGVNFFKFHLFGFSHDVIRFTRILEMISTVLLVFLFLVKRLRFEKFLAAFVALAWFKSQMSIEQLRWMTLIEQSALLFLMAGLYLHQRSKVLSYSFLILAALCKEPFWFLIPLPAFLQKDFREAFVATLFASVPVVYIFLNRHGYSGNYYSQFQFTPELLKCIAKLFLEFIWVPVLFYFAKPKLRLNSKTYSGFIFAGFALLYFVILLPKSQPISYLYAPVTVLLSIGLCSFLAGNLEANTTSRHFVSVVSIFSILFFAVFSWRLVTTYIAFKERHAILQKIADIPKENLIASNMPQDSHSISYAADLLSGSSTAVRPDGPYCPTTESLKFCCENAQYLVLGKEGGDFQKSLVEANRQKLELVFRNPSWNLFKCH